MIKQARAGYTAPYADIDAWEDRLRGALPQSVVNAAQVTAGQAFISLPDAVLDVRNTGNLFCPADHGANPRAVALDLQPEPDDRCGGGLLLSAAWHSRFFLSFFWFR
jgi:hypothetical protein